MKQKSVNIQIKAYQINGDVLVINSYKRRRISHFIQTVKNLEIEKYYLRVSYGKGIDNRKEKVPFINEGEYKNHDQLKQALNAFLEK